MRDYTVLFWWRRSCLRGSKGTSVGSQVSAYTDSSDKLMRRISLPSRKSWFVPLSLLVIMALLYFWHGRAITGRIVFGRSDVANYGIREAALLSIGLFFLSVASAYRGLSLVINREHKPIFMLMSAWVALCILSLAHGILLGNKVNYALGDFYKFVQLPLLFFLVYFCISSIRQIYVLYTMVLIVWIVFAGTEIWQFRTAVASGMRLTSYSVLTGSRFIPIALPLLWVGRNPFVKLTALVGVLLALLCPVVSQTRVNSISTVLALIIFCWLLTRCRVKICKGKKCLYMLFIPLLVGLGILAFSSQDNFLKTPFRHLMARFRQPLTSQNGLLAGVVEAGGKRGPEASAIYDKFLNEPAKIFGGFGCGSEYELHSVSRHFVHIGLVGIFLRMGLTGLLLFLVMLIYSARYAFRGLNSSPHFLMPASVLGITLASVLLLGANPFLTPLHLAPVWSSMLRVDRR